MRTAIAAVTIATLTLASAARAEDPVATPAFVTFDEIDHVYTSGDVPPPGAFDQSLQQVVPSAVAPASTPTAVPTQANPYARGALRTYAIASTGRVRIDDRDERVSIVFAPDIGKTYAIVETGTKIPADQLLMYAANAIERKTSAGFERYTLVIERGNLRTAATAPSGIFEIPDGYRPI